MNEGETASDAATFQRMGDYEILGVLGAGGMGKVYKVRNVLTDRIEAMKILLPDLAGQKELANRFLREIKLLAGLSHPNIASLRTALTVGNQLVMIMELVEGVTLAARLEQGALPPPEAVNYINQVLAALSYAHREHIIHRDIKPANMMLTPQGVVKLMDFGIARAAEDRSLTMTGTTLGSLYYMSPEQIRGETVDARSDLYSVGVSLYELVTGRRPFQASANYSIMAAHLQQAPPPPAEWQPSLPSALNELILMALAKDPGQRFQSAEAFSNALRSIGESSRSRTHQVVSAPLSPGAPALAGATAVFQESTAKAAGPAAPPVQPVLPLGDQRSFGRAPGAAPGFPTQPETSRAASPLPGPSPAMQPVPAPTVQRGYRGLYMTLGALVVVAVLVAAGLYGPRWAKTRANGGSVQVSQPTSYPPSSAVPPSSPTNNGEATANANSSTNPDSGTPAGSSPQPPSNPPLTGDTGAGSSQPAGEPSQIHGRKAAPTGVPPRVQTVPKATADSSNSPSAGTSQGNQPQQAGNTPTTQAQPADSGELDKLQDELDQLSSRARAAKDSVENLRRQQNAQGLNLRGDIAAAEDRMGVDIDKAQAALQNQNAKDARRYMEKTEAEVETLEKFLGRR
jgi:eukaryotic-like serine/threonine-protein kinase